MMGQFLSLKGQIATSHENCASLETILCEVTEKLRRYQNDVGFGNCCYILRDQGPEISLMTEIVFKWQEIDTFRASSDPKLIKRRGTDLKKHASNTGRQYANSILGSLSNVFKE